MLQTFLNRIKQKLDLHSLKNTDELRQNAKKVSGDSARYNEIECLSKLRNVSDADEEMALSILSRLLGQPEDAIQGRFSKALKLSKKITLPVGEIQKLEFLHQGTLDDEYGDEWKNWGQLDLPIVAEIVDRRVVLEGNHRLNQAIKDKRPIKVNLVTIDWVKNLRGVHKTLRG
jgi:hypothetical protein